MAKVFQHNIICQYCMSDNINKNGKQNHKQRYICQNCKKSFILTNDNRVKYDNNIKFEIIKKYLHCKNITQIEKSTGIPDTTIARWIKRFYGITKQKLKEEIEKVDKTRNEIELIEGNNIYKYINKRLKKENEFYACLFTDDGIKFVIFNKKS